MKAAFTFIFTSVLFWASAQQSFVFVRNHPNNLNTKTSIELKWFSSEFINDEGFYVYRREIGAGTWSLLTSAPVLRSGGIPNQYLREDEELQFFVDVINQSPEDLQEEFVLLNVILKSFQSNPFAKFLGIYFEDGTAVAGTDYQYRVMRLTGGKEFEVGTSDIIKAGPYAKNAAVKGVEVYQEGKEIAINWEQDEKLFYAVNIYQEDPSGVAVKLNQKPVMLSMVPDSAGRMAYPRPMFRKRGFQENQRYIFYLEGLDYFGETTEVSDSVNLIFDDTTPPPAPYGLDGKADSMRVKLHWNQDLVADFKGYNVFRSIRSNGDYEKVNRTILTFNDSTYSERIKVPGPYYYYVEAVDHADNRSRSDLAFVEVQDVTPPLPPEGLTIESDTGRFRLKWKPNDEPDLMGYYLFRTVDNNSKDDYLLMNAEPLDTSYFEQVLPENVKNEFYYYLVAVDTSYNRSKPSGYATSSLPDVTPPEKPFIKLVDYTNEGIVVEWSPNVEDDLAGYHIYRADSNANASYTRLDVNVLQPVTFRYIDRSAVANKDYLYRLRSIDEAGNLSAYSDPAFARYYQEEVVEEALSLKLKHKKRKRTNRLEWNAITSTEIKGYMLFRGRSKRTMKPYTELLKDKTIYTDKVDKDTEHFYQVRAYTQAGQVIYSPIIEYESN